MAAAADHSEATWKQGGRLCSCVDVFFRCWALSPLFHDLKLEAGKEQLSKLINKKKTMDKINLARHFKRSHSKHSKRSTKQQLPGINYTDICSLHPYIRDSLHPGQFTSGTVYIRDRLHRRELFKTLFCEHRMATMVGVFDGAVVEKHFYVNFQSSSKFDCLWLTSRESLKELICQKKNGGH